MAINSIPKYNDDEDEDNCRIERENRDSFLSVREREIVYESGSGGSRHTLASDDKRAGLKRQNNEVVQAIGVSQSAISRIWNRFLEIGSAGRRPGQGRRRATTPNEVHYLMLMAWRHRNMNTTLLQQHLHSATGTTISTQLSKIDSMV
ncbi:transposable element Tcb2 transposase [Trichonephila clavipes]|nr:transposable element Tcb2 transposase [Trichonephila clavipes]